MDYNALLSQECPAFIAEHVRSADIYTAESIFWPVGYDWPNDFPPQCVVAMLGFSTPKIKPDAPVERLSGYFYLAWVFAKHLPVGLVQEIGGVAAEMRVSEGLSLNYFRAMRALKIDIRAAIEPQFRERPAEGPVSAFDVTDRYYQYMLYRAVLDDREAREWIVGLIGRLVLADDIIRVHMDLKENTVPGWQDILKMSFDDNRQTPGVSGCGGMIVGQHAQFATGIWPPKPMKGVIVRKPGARVPKSCEFDR